MCIWQHQLPNLSLPTLLPGAWRRNRLPTAVFMAFPGGSDGKESTCSAGNLGSIPGLGRSPGGRHGNPLQFSCLECLHGHRSLSGCSPWHRKESDTAEATQHITAPYSLVSVSYFLHLQLSFHFVDKFICTPSIF